LAAIGLFGGTFDPVHFGHLRLATELGEAFHLEKVVFIPAGLPYHRGHGAHASNEQRLTMLKLATARDARFDVDDRELKRAGNTYTYDTLVEIRKERGPDFIGRVPATRRAIDLPQAPGEASGSFQVASALWRSSYSEPRRAVRQGTKSRWRKPQTPPSHHCRPELWYSWVGTEKIPN